MYTGENIISVISKQEIAKCIQMASGENGNCVDYIRQLVEKFDELGIEDEVISNAWNEVQKIK